MMWKSRLGNSRMSSLNLASSFLCRHSPPLPPPRARPRPLFVDELGSMSTAPCISHWQFCPCASLVFRVCISALGRVLVALPAPFSPIFLLRSGLALSPPQSFPSSLIHAHTICLRSLARHVRRLTFASYVQAEQIERIDTNMDDALHHVDQGHSQLVKYYQTLTSNRALMAKIFFVLLISMVFFIIFGT